MGQGDMTAFLDAYIDGCQVRVYVCVRVSLCVCVCVAAAGGYTFQNIWDMCMYYTITHV